MRERADLTISSFKIVLTMGFAIANVRLTETKHAYNTRRKRKPYKYNQEEDHINNRDRRGGEKAGRHEAQSVCVDVSLSFAIDMYGTETSYKKQRHRMHATRKQRYTIQNEPPNCC